MLGLEMVVVVGIALLLCGALAQRFPVAPAISLLAVGVLLGFVPTLRDVQLPPEVVLLLFLPALLYWESLTTSLREIRSNLRVVVLTSTVLVAATAGAVAAVAHHLLGMAWGPAWVLGAALAPTDATAVGVLARALPRRIVTVLRAESLVNDGTALVIYGIAVGITVGQQDLGFWPVSWLLVLSYGGGVLAGVLVWLLSSRVRSRIDDPTLENIAVLVTPFAAFLLADLVHASGVLAVVVCGLLMSQTAPRITSAAARQQMVGFWSLATTVLSSSLFLLVGLQGQSAIRNLISTSSVRALVDIVAVTAVVIGTRWIWLYTTPYLIRLVDRRQAQRARRIGCASTDGLGHRRVQRRGVTGSCPRGPEPAGLRSSVPRPRPHHRDHLRRHRADPASGTVPTGRRAVVPTAGRQLRRRGAALGRGRDDRRRIRGDRADRPASRQRRTSGGPGPARVRQEAEAARRRRRR